jgi:hypothetical protein
VLPQDVVTQLLVQAVDGSSAGLTGLFTPTQRTRAGCQCKQRWQYQASPTDELMTVYGTCINPKGAASAAFCAYEPDSCAEGAGHELECNPVVVAAGLLTFVGGHMLVTLLQGLLTSRHTISDITSPGGTPAGAAPSRPTLLPALRSALHSG